MSKQTTRSNVAVSVAERKLLTTIKKLEDKLDAKRQQLKAVCTHTNVGVLSESFCAYGSRVSRRGCLTCGLADWQLRNDD